MATQAELDAQYEKDQKEMAEIQAAAGKDGGGPLIPPKFIGGDFPAVATIPNYKKIPANNNKFTIGEGAGYSFVDPLKFSASFGDFTSKRLEQNFAQAKQFGLDAVDAELEGLLNFVPKSSALKREQIALDNTFNQAQRTAQINATDPNLVTDLNTVASNARAFAEGRLPDSIQDRALELGLRSSAADSASFGGFGVKSSASGKLSDLISADKRYEISKYGNELLGKSATQRADLLLAPTEYSKTGDEIKVMPSKSAADQTSSFFTDINKQTLLDPATAFTSAINQSQFYTQLKQRTLEFNANMRADLTKFNRDMRFKTNTFNANAKNEFALSYFNYLKFFADATAGVANANTNLGIMIDQQNKAQDAYTSSKNKTQNANDSKAWWEGIAAILGSTGTIVSAADDALGWMTGK